MKILMLIDVPAEYSPSAWSSCLKMRPFLVAQGHHVDVWPATSAAIYNRLVRKAHFRGRGLLYWYGLAFPQRCIHILLSTTYDVVVVHKSLLHQGARPYLERILCHVHPRVIYHFDDAVHLAGQPGNAIRIQKAKAVWTGSEPLAEYAKEHNSRVFFIEEAVDVDRYMPKTDYETELPTLVWTGTPYSSQRLDLLEEPLSALAKRKRFQVKVICREPFHFKEPSIPTIWVPWSLESEPRELYASDIGLMPLQDSAYARCKQNLKVKIYMACGLPVVCSPVGKNKILVQEGETGFLADTTEEWMDKLEALMEDSQLRARMGKRARQIAENAYSIEAIGPQMEAMFKTVKNLSATSSIEG